MTSRKVEVSILFQRRINHTLYITVLFVFQAWGEPGNLVTITGYGLGG
jgi:hypothetical protein